MWKKIRITVLLLILATAVQQTWLDKVARGWKGNFYVAVYPINADGSAKVAAYIATLSRENFTPIADYFADEGTRYNAGLRRPVDVQLGAQVQDLPPAPPEDRSILSTMIWSLKFRYFAWVNSPTVNIKPDIRLYLLYYDPATHHVLTESTALDKGRIGRVNLFGDASYNEQNLVVTAHELLHTFGATDKYDLSNNLPQYPDGFAEPDKAPLYPQDFAEVMAGRLPISETRAESPKNLTQTLICYKTAREIGWMR